MNHGSLFSGIGGFDLAAQMMGWKNVFHCEINHFGQQILKYYWPDAISYSDITKTDFTVHRGTIDILTGGFPCQPFSIAGKRKGTEDNRHLWPEMLRAIREIQPRWVVGENVFGITNWSNGMVFEQVQADLETAGYEVQPYILPACAVNAPHRRDRVWFVAYNSNARVKGLQFRRENRIYEPEFTPNTGLLRQKERQKQSMGIEQLCEKRITPNTNGNGYELRGPGEDRSAQGESTCEQEQRERVWANDRGIGEPGPVTHAESVKNNGNRSGGLFSEPARIGEPGTVADTNSKRHEECKPAAKPGKQERFNSEVDFGMPSDWSNFPTQSPVCGRNDGLSAQLDGITVSKHRNESIKAYGNAIVPQVVIKIFESIELYETLNK